LKAQRCSRKADSFVRNGLFDEALLQLDKSIVYLNELKSLNTRNDLIQMLNVQIESIDRKMRSVAIRKSERAKVYDIFCFFFQKYNNNVNIYMLYYIAFIIRYDCDNFIINFFKIEDRCSRIFNQKYQSN
jgi:hypothetical protein